MSQTSTELHKAEDLIQIFNRLFRNTRRTILVRGDGEPVYHTWRDDQEAQVVFAHGYFSSALHEIAHWCISGPERLKVEDYGYWYLPDGRTEAQQKDFEAVEIKPQALEWLFSLAADYPFVFSADNLDGDIGDMATFKANVVAQVGRYLRRRPKRRAQQFLQALCEHYGTAPKMIRLREHWPNVPEAMI
jgi:elongation factor P hydroxylase